jgi:nucleotide-binding universal stress UspA family protein
MRRVLIAICGHEPSGWADEVVRALSPTDTGVARVLIVLDEPSPPFTSLLPAARRYYRAALTEWRRLAEERTGRSVEALSSALGRVPDVVRVVARDADAAGAIVEHAAAWGADVIIVGRDTPGPAARALLAPIHARVVTHAPCAVLVTSADRGTQPQGAPMDRSEAGRESTAAVPRGA